MNVFEVFTQDKPTSRYELFKARVWSGGNRVRDHQKASFLTFNPVSMISCAAQTDELISMNGFSHEGKLHFLKQTFILFLLFQSAEHPDWKPGFYFEGRCISP